MKSMRTAALSALLILAALPYLALAQEHPKSGEHPANAEHPGHAEHPAVAGDLLAVASGAGNFKTLITAIKAAELTAMLQGEGPCTLFAPTDEAFAKLAPGTLDELLKPKNKAKLAGILSYHILSAKVMAAEVKSGKAKTVNGEPLSLKVEEGNVTVNGAKLLKADIAASNGVIHAIDTVLMPTAASGKPKDHPGH